MAIEHANSTWDNNQVTCWCCSVTYERPMLEIDGVKKYYDFMYDMEIRTRIDTETLEEEQWLYGICGKCKMEVKTATGLCPHWSKWPEWEDWRNA